MEKEKGKTAEKRDGGKRGKTSSGRGPRERVAKNYRTRIARRTRMVRMNEEALGSREPGALLLDLPTVSSQHAKGGKRNLNTPLNDAQSMKDHATKPMIATMASSARQPQPIKIVRRLSVTGGSGMGATTGR